MDNGEKLLREIEFIDGYIFNIIHQVNSMRDVKFVHEFSIPTKHGNDLCNYLLMNGLDILEPVIRKYDKEGIKVTFSVFLKCINIRIELVEERREMGFEL